MGEHNLCPLEYDEQVAVISWARQYAAVTHDWRLELLHGDSSGVRVPIGCAVKMKRAGSITGWPDLFLPVPLGDSKTPGLYYCCGLFIELKRQRRGVVSDEQITIHELLRKLGYRVEVCRGADAAIECIKKYLGI